MITGPSNTALVLLGHGSSANDDSGMTVFQHANSLQASGRFGGVYPAFWKQAPRITDLLAGLKENQIFIVPLFLSEGYFAEQIIPTALGFGDTPTEPRHLVQGGRTLYYTRSVGTHPRMAEAVVAQAKEVLKQHPFPFPPPVAATTLILAGHGTLRYPASRKAIEDQAERIAAMDLFAAVHPAFLEETPRIDQCLNMAPSTNVIVVPFFIGDGSHVSADIPVLLGASKELVAERLRGGQPPWRNPTEMKGKRIWYAASVGHHPILQEVILDRVTQGVPESPDDEPSPL